MSVYEEVCRLFDRLGDSAYLGEPVSQREHALQAAALAEQEGASDSLIIAALLHDVGHLLTIDRPDDNPAATGIDAHHEDAGATWLAQHFGDVVAEPARLHVSAKRYLCATEPEYLSSLSLASVQSLRLQGGSMSAGEALRFDANPFATDALRLRRWDDAAKESGRPTPGLDHYRERIDQLERAKP